MKKRSPSERDICTKYITPAMIASGWDVYTQIREEVSFTKGRIYVRGKLHWALHGNVTGRESVRGGESLTFSDVEPRNPTFTALAA